MTFTKDKLQFLIFRTLGNFFILISLYGFVATFGPALRQEVNFRFNSWVGVKYVVADTPKSDEADQTKTQDDSSAGVLGRLLLSGSSVHILEPVDPDFSIIIPKIGANAKVLSDVDPSDENSYLSALNIGVAHAAGTGYPGVTNWNRNIYLFAHSTNYPWNEARYNAIFYLLKELNRDDEVDLFYQGKRFVYVVTDKRIVGPKEVSYLTEPTAEEQLTLQTCWPPGTTLNRLLVIAKPKSQLSEAR